MPSAQTVQQWHDKIKRWVPSWHFQNRYNLNVAVTDALFYAAAAVFQQIEQDMLDQQNSTFILNSTAPIIDLLGRERSFPRVAGEDDADYEVGVQNCLFVKCGEPTLYAAILAEMNNGVPFMILNQQYGFYNDADVTETPGFLYYNDEWSFWQSREKTYNWWTVVIPIQTGGDMTTIAANIVAAIELTKAAGTTYDIIFLTNLYFEEESGGEYFESEDGQQFVSE